MPAVSKNAESLRKYLKEAKAISFAGAYDVFSAKLAKRKFDGIFLSGFSFSASFLGKPDIGCFSSEDISDFARRLIARIPDMYVLVDCEDDFGDEKKNMFIIARTDAANPDEAYRRAVEYSK